MVGPFELNGVSAQLLGLPGADIADLAIAVVIPTLARNRVGDRLAQLMRAGRGYRIDCGERTAAARAVGIGHHRVEDLAVDVVVVAAEGRARARSAKAY